MLSCILCLIFHFLPSTLSYRKLSLILQAGPCSSWGSSGICVALKYQCVVCLPMNLWAFWGPGYSKSRAQFLKINIDLNGCSLGHQNSHSWRSLRFSSKIFPAGLWDLKTYFFLSGDPLKGSSALRCKFFLGWSQWLVNHLSYETSLD